MSKEEMALICPDCNIILEKSSRSFDCPNCGKHYNESLEYVGQSYPDYKPKDQLQQIASDIFNRLKDNRWQLVGFIIEFGNEEEKRSCHK